jgi:hypothetical protein
MDYMNLVYVRHPGCDKPFIFQMPLNQKAQAGDRFVVDTMVGRCHATAAESSFITPIETARCIVTMSGGYFPPAWVAGRLQDIVETKEVLFPVNPDELPF